MTIKKLSPNDIKRNEVVRVNEKNGDLRKMIFLHDVDFGISDSASTNVTIIRLKASSAEFGDASISKSRSRQGVVDVIKKTNDTLGYTLVINSIDNKHGFGYLGLGVQSGSLGNPHNAILSAGVHGSHAGSHYNLTNMLFKTSGTDNESERMRIDHSGSLGLGTTTPQALLHLSRDDNGTGAVMKITSQDDAGIVLEADTNNAGEDDNTYIHFIQVGGLAFASIGHIGNNGKDPLNESYTGTIANGFLVGTYDDGADSELHFGTKSAVRMTIRGDNGNTVVGSTTSQACGIFEIVSTTQGFLPPRMTTVQRDAVASPVAGLMVYNTTTNKLNFYNGSAWEQVTSST